MKKPKLKEPLPFAFVLDELASLAPLTRPMFGCTAVYARDQIVMVLRERPTAQEDNGVWIATTPEHHASLRKEFPNMRSIGVLTGGQGGETGWQILPAESRDFEEAALRLCTLVIKGDPRIGKTPAKKKKRAKAAPARKPRR